MVGARKMSSLILRNVRINGRRTSVRLEREMWEALQEICVREGSNLNLICNQVADRNGERGLTSGLRVFIVNYYRGRGLHGPRSSRGAEEARPAP